MKPFLFCILIFISFLASAQEIDKDIDIIEEALSKRPKDYFKLSKIFNKQKIEENLVGSFLEKSKKEKYIIGEVFSYIFFGRLCRNRSLFEESLDYYNHALTLSKRIENVEAQIVILNQIGVVYRRQDKIRNALTNHQSALELAEGIEKPSMEIRKSISISENSIGNIYITLKQYELALERFEKAITFQKESGNLKGIAINYQNIGSALENLGFLDEALKNFQLSLKFNVENNSKVGYIICSNSISNILVSMKEYERALQIIEPVLPKAIELDDKFYLAQTYKNLGHVQLKLGELEKARKSLNEVLRIGEKYNIKRGTTVTYAYLSELYVMEGDFENALHYYKKSQEEKEKTFNERNLLYVNDLITKYDSEIKNNQIKNLARENEITKLKLTENRNILIITLVSLALLSVVWYSFNRHKLLRNDKKILMLKQEALQNQMNPHFIFNALNSIKLYIINNEQKNAVYYLNKFSKLIRNILESSKVKEVSLQDELKTMKLYMSIENIRFSNEIDYIEKINPEVNIGIIKIPPLVLQPFLENAIWHGLSSKKGRKEVILSVDKILNNFIQISIIDNGIGREAAQKIKESKSLKRKSIGIDLTKERLRNFTSGYQNNYSLRYFDIRDDKNEIIGTKVSLRMPLR